ncbi:MAG: aminotransferase class V-fold PLP-dependent enzyme [Peptostreptococcales bacterium]
MNKTYDYLMHEMGIDKDVLEQIDKAEREVTPIFKELDDIMEYNQFKVLNTLQKCRISDRHFQWNTGYGYNDIGREALEETYATLFNTEDAIVRPLIVNGTHALTLTLRGILRPEDELIYATGGPYDTLEEVIGIKGENNGSLKDFNIHYKQVELTDDGKINLAELEKQITDKTKMITIQRATGYSWRKAITIEEIEECVQYIKKKHPNIVFMVDNCYGEFLDTKEPTDVGVDVMAGSLIKNPGGGLALSGGYIVGRKDLIEQIAYQMTSQGIGKECGLTFGQTRNIFHGLFIAPRTVNGAVKGAILCAKVFENLGYETCPKYDEKRSDIIECVKLGSPEAIIAFCEGIQAAAPVDAYVTPVPWEMPGYDSQVIMAAGAFVQGSSIELSADAPIREPYIVYFQGGITYEHSKYGVIKALQAMKKKNCLK